MSVASSPFSMSHTMFGANLSMLSRLSCEASIVGKCFVVVNATGSDESVPRLAVEIHIEILPTIRFIEHVMQLIEMLP